MLRTMCRVPVSIALAIAVSSCGGNSGNDDEGPATAVAAVEFQGASYDLVGVGECGARPDGTFSTWAFKLDADGEPLLDGPQLHALADENWSVIDFYSGNNDGVVRIYRDGADKLRFENGVLEFAGALGAGLTEEARVTITCPE